MNNGITIISGGQTSPTKPMRLTVEDPQIVNGLQTSREIFRYYEENKAINTELRDLSGTATEAIPARLANWSVLVKVIRVTDDVMRDAIIKATNSQNAMNSASLRATDAIHHQIETLFKQWGLFYDRRKGFYKDKGESIGSIISVTDLVQAVVAIILQRPDDARARPGDYIRKDSEYAKVFKIDDSFPLSVPKGDSDSPTY